MHTRIIAPKISVAQAIAPAVGTGTRKKAMHENDQAESRDRSLPARCLI